MPRDLRQYARQTNTHLFVGFLLILLIIGDGLIYFIYGPQAASLGLICMLLGLFPLVLVWLAMEFISWLAKHASGD